MNRELNDWELKLYQLLLKFGSEDMHLDYPSLNLDERRALYFTLIKHEAE